MMPNAINNSSARMSNVIVVNDTELTPIDIGGERYVTLAMIDAVHERPDGTARRNFNEHRERFEEGKHYLQMTPGNLREHIVRTSSEIPVNKLIPIQGRAVTLLTERGYLMLVKSFTDDLAWQVQDMLVESYFAKPAPVFDPTPYLNDNQWLRGTLLTYTEKVHALEGEVEEMRPQVEALERIALSDGSLCITDAAKTLQVRPKALFDFLKSHGWIYTRAGSNEYIAYQPKLQMGLLEHKTTVVTRSDGSEKTTTQVRVTPKGLTRLAKEFPPVAQAA